MLALIRTHWRCAVAVAFVGAVSFIGGRCTAPERVRVEERVVTEWKDRVEWWGGWTERRVEGKQRIRIVERDRPAAPVPPGCPACPPVHEVDTTIEKDPTTVEASGQVAGTQETKGRQEATRVVEPLPPPRYRVGALVGAQLVPLPPQPLLVGAHGEVRLGNWPLWAGVWAMADPRNPAARVEAGIGVAMEF